MIERMKILDIFSNHHQFRVQILFHPNEHILSLRLILNYVYKTRTLGSKGIYIYQFTMFFE